MSTQEQRPVAHEETQERRKGVLHRHPFTEELFRLMELILEPACDETLADIMEAIEKAIDLTVSIQAIKGIVDCGDYDPAAAAIRQTYTEMNIFKFDGDGYARIHVDHLLEGYQSQFIKNPMNNKRAYLVSATLARLDESLQKITLLEAGGHIERQLRELIDEDLVRKEKTRILQARYDELCRRYKRQIGESTSRGLFLKWAHDSLKEVLWVLKVGHSIADAVIPWYSKCAQKFMALSRAGVFDLERLPTPDTDSTFSDEFWLS